MKQCNKCHEDKPVAAYPKRGKVCKICRARINYERWYTEGKTCTTCQAPITNKNTSGYCKIHFGQSVIGTKRKDGKIYNSNGYVIMTGMYDHPNVYKNGKGIMPEHIYVMSLMLGRALIKGENVHHKNGVRDDNRPENLELWVTKQPYGQRAEDLLAWAKEIIERYDGKLPSNQEGVFSE